MAITVTTTVTVLINGQTLVLSEVDARMLLSQLQRALGTQWTATTIPWFPSTPGVQWGGDPVPPSITVSAACPAQKE